MGKLVVSLDGVVIKEVQITKDKTTLGRRPYNDIVIDNLAVSGEHAAIHMLAQDVEIEDLGSTNGTYVNAKAVKRQELRNGDTIEVGKYKIRFLHEAEGQNFEKTMIFKPGMVPPLGTASRPAPLGAAPATPITAIIRVMSGAAAGREVSLQKVVTTIGKPGVAVAVVTRRRQGYVAATVVGSVTLNGAPLGAEAVALQEGDVLELGGASRMQFVRI